MFFKKIISVLAVLTLLISVFSIGTAAATEMPSSLTDGKVSTKAEIKSELVINGKDAKYLYIIFWDKPVDFTLSNDGVGQDFKFEGKYLHRLIEIPKELNNANEIIIKFSKNATISEIKTFSSKPNKNEAQNWESNDTVCDLLVFSTHADDEQLFFAGVLPLYAADGITEVQVVYFTDHLNNIARRHELLNGLWEVGVTRYPVISNFPDAYSKSYEEAVKNLKNAGFSENDALAFQVEQIRRFKPLVILGHDLKGEYGHGQHILNSTMLTLAVEKAAHATEFSDSFITYGAHHTPKLYLHLYDKNKVTIDIDTPKEYLDGQTPFEVSKSGFAKHSSQQGTWFKTWLNGKNGEIKKASQIKTYSPREFGLYYTLVGEDVNKNDLFENVTRRSLLPQEDPILNVPAEVEPQENPTESSGNYGTYIALAACVLAAAICAIVVKKRKK